MESARDTVRRSGDIYLVASHGIELSPNTPPPSANPHSNPDTIKLLLLLSSQSFEPFAPHYVEQFQRCAAWVFLSLFPFTYSIYRNIEVMSKNCLAYAGADPRLDNLYWRHICNRNKASLVKFTHGLCVNQANFVKILYCFEKK